MGPCISCPCHSNKSTQRKDHGETGGNMTAEDSYQKGLAFMSGTDGEEMDACQARKHFEQAIDKGSVNALYTLGGMLHHGAEGLEKDGRRAREYYEQAIDKGNVDALYNLAHMLEDGAEGVEKDGRRAKEYYEQAIDKGNVDALNNLGLMLHFGAEGVEKDGRRAREYYEQAIDKGNVDALNNLGHILHEGAEGVEKDGRRAKEYYEQAIDKGNVLALYNLGHMLEDGAEGVEKDGRRAKEYYEQAIDKGNVDALYNLGHMLEDGAEGVEKDGRRAREYYEQAIDKGDVDALNNLGYMLHHGAEGVEEDGHRAREYYEQAIDRGNVLALFNLGYMFEHGAEGVEKDGHRAREYYEQAIEKGNSYAPFSLSWMLRVGAEGISKDVGRAIFILENSIVLHSRALDMHALAIILLADDVGALRNPVRAKALLEAAVREKFPPAMHELAELLNRGDKGVERDVVRAKTLFRLGKEEAASFNELGTYAGALKEWEQVGMTSGDAYGEVVDQVLRTEKVRPKQCSLLVIGGAGRGKTSVVRSLRGLPFVETHDATELVQLSRLSVKPGQRSITEEAISELVFNVESLIGNSTRLEYRGISGMAGQTTPSPSMFEIGQKTGYSSTDSIDNANSVINRKHCDGTNTPIMPDQLQQEGESKETVLPSDVNKSSNPDSNASASGLSGTLEDNKQTRSVNAESGTMQEMTLLGSRSYWNVVRKTHYALSTDSFPTYGTTSLLQCFDAAGQAPYMMTQSVFIGSAEILLVVVNLQNIASQSKVAGEVNTVCRWMEVSYSLRPFPDKTRVIIVGTRMASCGDVKMAWDTLFEGLKHNLGRKAYETWMCGNVTHIAIENSLAMEEPSASGLDVLESALKELSERIVQEREPVALRWIALIEELEKVEKLFLTRDEIMSFVQGFQLFGSDKECAEEDAMKALRYYHQVGRVFLFEITTNAVYLFCRPSTIIDFLRQVAGPNAHVERRLKSKDDVRMIEKGLLSLHGLRKLWDGYNTTEQDVMLNLLCKFDLLMKLEGQDGGDSENKYFIAIPALLPKQMKGFKWEMDKDELEVRALTRFEDGFPPEMMGSLISFLHRTIGGGQTKAGFLGFDAALLTVKMHFKGTARALVCMDKNGKQLKWTVRATKDKVMRVTRKCIEGLGQFLARPSFRMDVERSHFLIMDCKASGNGCGDSEGVEVEISRVWVNDKHESGIGNMVIDCGKCEKPWSGSELLKGFLNVSGVAGASGLRMVYDVFISHAGSEKELMAIPMQELLEKNGLKCFLDEHEMGMSQKDVGQQLDYALSTSRIVILIMTVEFVSRKWPMVELRRVLKLWLEAQKRMEKGPIIFPLFYGLSVDECKDVELASREKYIDVFRKNGYFRRQNEWGDTIEALKKVTSFAGFRNDLGESDEAFLARVGEHVTKRYAEEFGGGKK